MFGSQLLRVNLTYQNVLDDPQDLILEGPTENALVTDDRGRRYSLIEATGISGDRPVRVLRGGMKKFSLVFPFQVEGVSGFKFEALLRISDRRAILRWEGRVEKFR